MPSFRSIDPRRPCGCRVPGAHALLIVFLSALPGIALAQGPPSSPVRYTEVRAHDVKAAVKLPGTVESRSASLLASEVQGLVVETHARAGDLVRQGSSLARLRTTDLELRLRAARGQLGEAEARLTRADHALVRARGLFDENLVSQDELDQAFAEFRAWEARVVQLGAEIGRIELDIERCDIRSPLAGVVVSEEIEIGEWLNVGDPVVEIVSLDDLEIRVEVAEQLFPQLTLGAAAHVEFEASSSLAVDGSISALIPRANRSSRTFPILVSIPNPERRIAVGMLAQVSLPLGQPYAAALIPKDAIVRQGPNEYVFLIGDDETVSRVEVITGDGYGAWLVVHDGVEVGQRVVTRGNERLFPGQSVQGEALEYELP